MSVSGALIRSVIAPLWAAKEGTPYLRHLAGLADSKRRPLAEVRAAQLQQLKRLLSHCHEHSPFYRGRFDAAGFRPEQLASLSDLSRIPLLTKDDIRLYKDAMVADNFTVRQLVDKKTSGSTGVSLEFKVDEESMQWKRAVAMSYDRWAGWDIGERVGAIWGNPQHRVNWRARLRNALLERFTYLDTLKMDEDAMHSFYRELRAKPPALLFGHAHSLFLFARFLQSQRLDGIRPQGVLSTCMVLHDFERRLIEEVFGCKVTNRYGCEEVSLIACECREGNMHLNCDSLIVELVREGRAVEPGEPGAIVVTDLTNYGMPFVRYKVGDVAVPSAEGACPCGCSYPILSSLQGRVADYVVTPEGNYISGISLTENFAMELPGIKQLQIVQERIDRLLFRVVKGELFAEETERDMERLARERFGGSMRWEVEYVQSIQSESSGKYRFCISKLPNLFS